MNETKKQHLSAVQKAKSNIQQITAALKNEGYNQNKIDSARCDALKLFTRLENTIKGEKL